MSQAALQHPHAPDARLRGLIVPAAAAALILVILIPLPPMLMDILLAGSITLAAVVFLTTIFVSSPMEFSVFPSVLLGATLLRLVLNIASTRLILTAGEGGRTLGEARFAAGQVIWTFSEFVASGSLAVGVILFAIIAIIQFVVITKGAARISEVAARFVLDAMPGRQMAIDADLNAGLIDEAEARCRRDEVSARADFYGAMDGASKFLRGDAIAAVVITLVNIFGGLYVGMVQYGWGWQQTVGLFTRLTIGDGLVTQIPALLVSVSAALMVTRSTARTDLGEEILSQLTCRPAVLAVTAAFLGILTLTSLPTVPLTLLAAVCALAAWRLHRSNAQAREAVSPEETSGPGEGVRKALTVRPMQIELGYALLPLVDRESGGRLIDRIAEMRQRLGERLGLIIPPVWVKDNMDVRAHEYRICIRGAVVATGRLRCRQLLATGDVEALRRLKGSPTGRIDEGQSGAWISPHDRHRAEMMNLQIREPLDVLIEHIEQVAADHAPELLSRQRVAEMLEALEATAGEVVAEARRKLSIGRIQRLLHALLAEQVSIRDGEAVLEAICEASDTTEDTQEQIDMIRQRLGRSLCQPWLDEAGRLRGAVVEADIEAIAMELAGDARRAMLQQGQLSRATDALKRGVETLRETGRSAVLVCEAGARRAVAALLRRCEAEAVVLGRNEIQDVPLDVLIRIGLSQAAGGAFEAETTQPKTTGR
jgi:flagellar biosynthesis protein FlhA